MSKRGLFELVPPKSTRQHLVAEVHFTHGSPSAQAPVRCICGWAGTVAEHDIHRKETQ